MNVSLLPPAEDAAMVFIASWEIECCAPPPTVGQMTSWRLRLFPTSNTDPHYLPPAVSSLEWQIEPWPTPDGPHRMLSRGGIVALLSAADSAGLTAAQYRSPDPLPPPGRHRIPGVLCGSKHGGMGEGWESFPVTTALVGSVRLVTVTGWVRSGPGIAPARGSYYLTPHHRSPVRFERGGPVEGLPSTDQTGILIRLR